MSDNQIFMEEALKLANEALEAGEVPIGCVIVHGGEVVATGRNTVNATKNATRHAEFNAFDTLFDYCKEHNKDRDSFLAESVLYVTVEPCAMCASAIAELGLRNLVFGCSNDRFGGCGSITNVFHHYSYEINIEKGLLADEAIKLLKKFYTGTNPNAPSGKVKRKSK